jgi:hypothetical protein
LGFEVPVVFVIKNNEEMSSSRKKETICMCISRQNDNTGWSSRFLTIRERNFLKPDKIVQEKIS